MNLKHSNLISLESIKKAKTATSKKHVFPLVARLMLFVSLFQKTHAEIVMIRHLYSSDFFDKHVSIRFSELSQAMDSMANPHIMFEYTLRVRDYTPGFLEAFFIFFNPTSKRHIKCEIQLSNTGSHLSFVGIHQHIPLHFSQIRHKNGEKLVNLIFTAKYLKTENKLRLSYLQIEDKPVPELPSFTKILIDDQISTEAAGATLRIQWLIRRASDPGWGIYRRLTTKSSRAIASADCCFSEWRSSKTPFTSTWSRPMPSICTRGRRSTFCP